MNRRQLNEILEQLKGELEIDEPIKIELRPMKIKAASISISKNTIRINKNILSDLDVECIRYLLLHELIHYKLKSTYHNGEFYKQLTDKISESKVRQLEGKIIEALLQLNRIL